MLHRPSASSSLYRCCFHRWVCSISFHLLEGSVAAIIRMRNTDFLSLYRGVPLSYPFFQIRWYSRVLLPVSPLFSRVPVALNTRRVVGARIPASTGYLWVPGYPLFFPGNPGDGKRSLREPGPMGSISYNRSPRITCYKRAHFVISQRY